MAELEAAPRGPRPTPFGSVWDSQIGTPSSTPAGLSPLGDDDDLDEPEIPEYLIAEQRRGQQGRGGGRPGRGGGARGEGAGYAAAIDRERYGRGGGSGGINRYPDVSERERTVRGGGGGGGRWWRRTTGPVRVWPPAAARAAGPAGAFIRPAIQ